MLLVMRYGSLIHSGTEEETGISPSKTKLDLEESSLENLSGGFGLDLVPAVPPQNGFKTKD